MIVKGFLNPQVIVDTMNVTRLLANDRLSWTLERFRLLHAKNEMKPQ